MLQNGVILLLTINYAAAGILTPPYFNLVTNKKVEATATCGEGIADPEFYCKLTGSTATDRETSNFANLVSVQVWSPYISVLILRN